MTENKTKVSEELSKAGETSLITPLLLKLDKLRIVSTSDIEDEDFLFNINGKPCLPRKDLTVITGQPKTGKTMLISILMACCARDREQGGLVGIERIRQEPLKVMWVDTEQNPQSTQYILRKRVMQLIDGEFPEDRFFVFNVRSVDVGERYDLIAEGVDAYRPDILIVDNVRDLVSDINNGEKAQELIESFMRLSQTCECNIVTVIHQNRSAENRGLRGWLGTELMNKAFEVYACQKLRQKSTVLCVTRWTTTDCPRLPASTTAAAAEALQVMARLQPTPLTRTTSSAIPRTLTALGNGTSGRCSGW